MMKKILISFVLTAVLVANMGAAPAMAAEPTANNPICTVTDCTKTGEHSHNGDWYAAHSQ